MRCRDKDFAREQIRERGPLMFPPLQMSATRRPSSLEPRRSAPTIGIPEVITRGGCDSLYVEANERNRAGTIIGDLIDSRDNIPPKTRVLFELGSTSGVTDSVASSPTITCF